MARFRFRAENIKGRKIVGEMEAIDESDVRAKMRAQMLVPLKIEMQQGMAIVTGKKLNTLEVMFAPKVATKDLQIFTRQFATLINAGINVADALQVLETGLGTPLLRLIIGKVRAAVSGGKGLGEALAMHPMTFDNFFTNMVKAGEMSGSLDTILGRMAGYLEKAEKLKSQLKSAMMYPIAIMFVAVGVVTGILLFVIPKFEDIYKSGGKKLPGLTQMVVDLSHALKDSWYILVLLFIVVPLGLVNYYRTDDGKRTVDAAFMKVPLFGEIILKASVARFSRTMETLLRAGVNLMDAVEIAARTTGNHSIEQILLKSRESVAIGKSFSEPLAKGKLIPTMVSQMVMIGEQTGSLDQMLGKVADFYEDEVDNAVKGMTSMMEPILLVFIGGIVAVLVVAMYLPIFNMADTMK